MGKQIARRFGLAAAIIAAFCIVGGCKEPPAEAFKGIEVIDDVERTVRLVAPAKRIVSLSASSTEILFELGLGGNVVGVDSYSDRPKEARSKPKVAGFSDPDLELIVGLEPDLVLASSVNRNAVDALVSRGIPVAVLAPHSVANVADDLLLVGKLTGREQQAGRIAEKMRHELGSTAVRINGLARKRVFIEISPDLYTAGRTTFLGDLIAKAGGSNIADGSGAEWPQLSKEALIASDPDVILIADGQAGVKVEDVLKRPGWSSIKAVRNRRVVLVDPDLVERAGPRVAQALECIARAIHPEAFK